jgi:hypothetical protein
MDAGRLLERCAKQDEASAAAEMGARRAAHGPTVFRRTGAFARSICDLGLRMLALAAVDAEDPTAVEVVRGLREGPRTRPDATLRLVERRLEEPPALDAATAAVLCRRWPCCSRTGPEEVVAEAARKATFRMASAPAHLSAARGGVTTPRHRAA